MTREINQDVCLVVSLLISTAIMAVEAALKVYNWRAMIPTIRVFSFCFGSLIVTYW